MNILVLGATGMLGSAVLRVLSETAHLRVSGTIRSADALSLFPPELAARLIVVPEGLEDDAALQRLFDQVRPDVVVNCVSLNQATLADPMRAIAVFSRLPRLLADLCRLRGARLILMSSDGVFSGVRGAYTEDDLPDARDVYGIAKLLGEVKDTHVLSLRTSIIGHQIRGRAGLLAWFLSQEGECRCYRQAIFSGFPTVVLAMLIRDVLLPRPQLHGLYHVASAPISKFELLRLVAQVYGKSIAMVPLDEPVIDRSLCAARFEAATGYVAPAWPDMIKVMHSYQ